MKSRWSSEAKKQMARWVVPILLILPLALVVINTVPLFFCQALLTNTKHANFDVIIVLGNPANSDGSPGEIMRQRVLKALELFRDGRAKHMLFTGGAVYNSYVQAEVMAELARSLGVPGSACVTEPKSRNTYQNLFKAIEILRQNRWSSALIVTSLYHVKRTAFILSHFDLDYQVVPNRASWISQLLISQWENYVLTRIVLSGGSKYYGLPPEQIQRIKHGQ
jgi:uncharacterized SAM-binding protein YcdF (DUF218 family)